MSPSPGNGERSVPSESWPRYRSREGKDRQHMVSGAEIGSMFTYIQQLSLFRTFSSEHLMAHAEPMMKKANIFLQLKI